MLELLNPPHWPAPRGYTNCIVARGDLVFVAGQVGWTPDGKFPAKDTAGQLRQTLINIRDALAPSGARLTDIVRLTWYVTDKAEYLATIKEVGAAYREIMGKHYPAMSVVEVKALVESEAKLEIEATAVVPRA
ncbi:MAG: RidA family protein [Rhodospirillaceae bacterium]|nr:RidA family protein [Rhodospirillaceae bacterium]